MARPNELEKAPTTQRASVTTSAGQRTVEGT